MRFNIKEMKNQGIFLGILAGFLALVILVSYLTDITPAAPTEDEKTETAQTQTSSGENNKTENKNDKLTDGGSSDKKNEEEDKNGDKNENDPKPEHVHKWIKGTTVKPTCTEGGYTINTCSCGESKTSDEKTALGHVLGEWILQPADKDGVVYEVRECSECDYSEKKKIEIKEENNESNDNNENEKNDEVAPPAGDDDGDENKGDDENQNENVPADNPDKSEQENNTQN